MRISITATVVVPGTGSGEILVLDEPLSLWGGVDPYNGRINDPHHPQHGAVISNRILVMPHGRGSSSASSVLAELIGRGTGPAGIITRERDPILALGSIVATELFPDRTCPVLCVGDDYATVALAGCATIEDSALMLD